MKITHTGVFVGPNRYTKDRAIRLTVDYGRNGDGAGGERDRDTAQPPYLPEMRLAIEAAARKSVDPGAKLRTGARPGARKRADAGLHATHSTSTRQS